jgi:hypothetical protein
METIGTYTPENFYAGEYPIEKAVVPVAAGTTILRHAPVKLVDGAVAPVAFIEATEEIPAGTDPVTPAVPATTAEENTLAGLYGVSAEAGEDGAEIVVYLTGDFFGDALALEEDITIDTLKTAYRNIGIFIKEGIDNA